METTTSLRTPVGKTTPRARVKSSIRSAKRVSAADAIRKSPEYKAFRAKINRMMVGPIDCYLAD